MSETDLPDSVPPGRARGRVRRYGGVALTGGLATWLVFAVPAWLPGGFDAPRVERTARGEQRTLALPDGSTLELNTASRVEINYGLLCRCLRLLEGEAVLRVAHGDPRRFDVAVRGGVVRDIGTAFWLRDASGVVSVAVLEGVIEVMPNLDAAPQRLVAGERLAWDATGRPAPADAAPLAALLAWREGAVAFNDTPLPAALAEFARYHAVNLNIDTRLAGYRISGRFRTGDLDGFLKLLDAAYPLSVERDGANLDVRWRRG